MNNNTDCGLNAYTCHYNGCATHILTSHRPMTDDEARAIIVAKFGLAKAAEILGEKIAA